jgi:hypothetical protein
MQTRVGIVANAFSTANEAPTQWPIESILNRSAQDPMTRSKESWQRITLIELTGRRKTHSKDIQLYHADSMNHAIRMQFALNSSDLPRPLPNRFEQHMKSHQHLSGKCAIHIQLIRFVSNEDLHSVASSIIIQFPC